MLTLQGKLSECKRLNDPPPDISKYDCRNQKRREHCLIVDSSGQENTISLSGTEDILGTPFAICEDNRSKAWNCCGKDNFQITLNSTGRFLMNTAISVTVDFNPQLMSELDVKSIDNNVSNKKSLSSLVKSSSHIPMGEYYSQDTFNFQRERSVTSCVENLSSWHHSKASPAQKRVLSPRNGRSPNKRRKLFSPQKNNIYNYFVPMDSNETEISEQCYEVENSFLDDCKCRDTSRLCSTKRVVKNDLQMNQSVGADIWEVITISSDEEDSSVSVAVQEVQNKAKWKTSSNIVDLCDEKSSVFVNTCNKQSKMSDPRNLTVNLSDHSSDNEIIIVSSSDDDDDILISPQRVIDLTCDDLCSSDDAGGVIVPESKHFQKSLIEKDFGNDENDDRLSVISCQSGSLSQSMKDDIYTFSCKEKLLGSHVLPEVSPPEGTSHVEDLCSKFALLHPMEDNRNISDSSLEKQDDYSTDSSLPSPPHLFEDVSVCDTPVEGNDQETLCKMSSKTENYENTEHENEEQRGGFKRPFRLDDSETALPLPTVEDKIGSSFGEIVLQCNESKIHEKENADETTSEVHNKSFPKVISPTAMRVCQVQAEVLLSKFYQPWIDLDTDEVPQCCEVGPAECYSLHGKKEHCPEETDFYDELLLWKMDSGTSAVDLIQSRLDVFVYPSSSILQNLLFGCMDLWVEGVGEAIKWLRHLLRLHPPCAFGMLDYYRKVLFSQDKNMKAPDGIFWLCLTKIEDTLNEIQKQNSDNRPGKTSSDEEESSDFVEKFFQCSDILLPSEKEVHDVKHSDKLKQLFDTLDYMIRIMEADLNMGLLKNVSNLKRYTCKTGRPLIAVALWGTHGTVGNVNTKCRHLMKMYLQIVDNYHDIQYHRHFRRLISLMAGVTYASERNSEPPKFPNVESNCKDLSNAFASILMQSAFNMIEIRLILESLTPDWFRLCVCYNLVEKLYGRNMELLLRPTVSLLKSLNELNQDYPSDEEISRTLLAELDSNEATSHNSEELPPNYVKQATKKDKRGETRLHVACRRNNIQEVERLLNVPGISVNEKDNVGWTPLHEAAFHGSVECVKSLLNFRTPSGGPAVDLQARNKGGVTPLMDAVSKNNLEVASILLRCGGQKLLTDKNNEGLSAWDFARTEDMKLVLMNTQDCQEYDLLTIPRSLYVKLSMLTPLAIKYYINFSEVARIIYYLKHNIELTRNAVPLIKFQPIAFKQDYAQLTELQSFLKDKAKNNINNKLLHTLNFFT